MPEKEKEYIKKPHRYVDEHPELDFAFLGIAAIILVLIGIFYNFINIPNPTAANEILPTTNH